MQLSYCYCLAWSGPKRVGNPASHRVPVSDVLLCVDVVNGPSFQRIKKMEHDHFFMQIALDVVNGPLKGPASGPCSGPANGPRKWSFFVIVSAAAVALLNLPSSPPFLFPFSLWPPPISFFLLPPPPTPSTHHFQTLRLN